MVFRIGPHEAALFSEIDSLGVIQYDYILAIYDTEKLPFLFVCAEWSQLQPGLHFLGLFTRGAHSNLGQDNDIVDRPIFLLRSIEIARRHLSMDSQTDLSEGEALAITEVFKRINSEGGSGAADFERYGKILKKYDKAIVEYLKRSGMTR